MAKHLHVVGRQERNAWLCQARFFSLICLLFFALLLKAGCASMSSLKHKIDTYEASGKCFNCKGSGEVDCPQCKGRGWITCPDCLGSGGKSDALLNDADLTNRCPNCRGMGQIDCPNCNGFDRLICDRCGGTGEAPKKVH